MDAEYFLPEEIEMGAPVCLKGDTRRGTYVEYVATLNEAAGKRIVFKARDSAGNERLITTDEHGVNVQSAPGDDSEDVIMQTLNKTLYIPILLAYGYGPLDTRKRFYAESAFTSLAEALRSLEARNTPFVIAEAHVELPRIKSADKAGEKDMYYGRVSARPGPMEPMEPMDKPRW